MLPDSKLHTEQHTLAQKTLVDFLQADLDLCFTMLKTSEIASDPQHTLSALRHVIEGLLTIRRLAGRIKDPEAWKAVHERADVLDKILESSSTNRT
jgi:hypothetical protein